MLSSKFSEPATASGFDHRGIFNMFCRVFGYTACVFRKLWWVAVILLCLVLLCVATVFYFYRHHRTDRLVARPLQLTLPADGRMHPAFEIHHAGGGDIAVNEVRASIANLQLLQDGGNRIQALAQSPVTPGSQLLRLTWRKQTLTIPTTFTADYTDSYGDGTPDFLRLHSAEDRRAFREWFAGIAEAQAELPPGQLPAEIDDCAALLRYSYRQALHAHDEPWLLMQHFETLAEIPSVHQYQYPQTPLGAGLFRVRAGAFAPEDLSNGSFAEFADAKTLMQWNTHWISRDIHVARTGDMIFFRQLEQNSPYHSMVVTGRDAAWVVYDTGPIGKAKGEMRRVAIEDLLHHPDARWRPVPENSNFLGVYRWNILRDGQ